MSMNTELLRLIERKTGKTIDQLQSETLSERRKYVESTHGGPMKLIRLFPFVGRGSVMGDYLLSHKEVDRQLEHATR